MEDLFHRQSTKFFNLINGCILNWIQPFKKGEKLMYEQIIKTLVKNAADLPATTLIELLKLRPEQRSTDVSVKNLQRIQRSPLKFKIEKIVFEFKPNDPRLHTEWVSKDEDYLTWDFRGFSAGNISPASKGLVKALQSMGVKAWDLDIVSKLKPETYEIL